MSNTERRRITLAVGAAAGGLLAAAFLPIAIAVADEEIYVPDPTTFDPTQVVGFPPFSPQELMGTEQWSVIDLTTNQVEALDAFSGVDTHTVFGPLINDDFASTLGSSVDLANFGGGWENEWVDVAVGADAGASDLLITPFGDFDLFGPFAF